jgi:lysophospholipase L1-like esterase
MRRLFARALLMSFVLVVLGAVTSPASAAEHSWLNDPVKNISEVAAPIVSSDQKTCAGRMRLIQIVDKATPEEACVFGSGDSTKIARYRGRTGEFGYAMQSALDSMFVPIRGVCAGMTRCIYGYQDDTFLIQMLVQPGGYTYALVKDFTSYLVKEGTQYRFEYHEDYTYLRAGEYYVSIRAARVSSNGRWAVIELPSYGIIRFDMKTLHYTRIAAYDSLLPTAPQPIELELSDDGRLVFVVGYHIGILVYEVVLGCGDELTSESDRYFRSGSLVCNSGLIEVSRLVPGVSSVHVPKLTSDNRKLSVDVRKGEQFSTLTLGFVKNGTQGSYYVAFGDSFTSGEGELSDNFYINGTNTANNRCHVSSRSYPYLLGSFWSIGALNLACSGSRMKGVLDASRAYQSSLANPDPTIISVSVGGNDVDFMGKLKSCIGMGTCEWATKKLRKANAVEIKNLLFKVVDGIAELKKEHSAAAIFLVGYPDIINDLESAPCSFILSSLLDAEERRYMRESINYVNKVLRAAAEYSKVTFVDITDAYGLERLCDATPVAMNALRYGDDMAPLPFASNLKVIGAESFHPTPRGHELTARMIDSKLISFWFSPICVTCEFDDSLLAFSDYWEEGDTHIGAPLRQLSGVFLEMDTFIQVSTAQFSFLPAAFEPGSQVAFELHSQVQKLGEFTARSDGSLVGTFTLPPDIEGYHTVHAYGQTRSGERVDMYQTVYIDTTKFSKEMPSTPTLGGVTDKGTSSPWSLLGIADTGSQSARQSALGVVSGLKIFDEDKVEQAEKSSNQKGQIATWATAILVVFIVASTTVYVLVRYIKIKRLSG